MDKKKQDVKKKTNTKTGSAKKKVDTTKNNKVVEEVKVSKKKVDTKKNNDRMTRFYEWFDKYHLAVYGAVGGILLTTLVTVIIWPDRIAKLKDGTEPVAEIEGLTITADDLYEDMKNIYSVSALLDKIDRNILEEKYPETDEMNDEVQSQADNYYSVYEQYQKISKEEFLSNNGFASEKEFLDYLKLQYRKNKYAEDYAKTLIKDSEVEKYYEDKVFGDINTKHILVNVESTASTEEKEEALNKAKEIISKLDEGKTFDEVKEEYKDGTTYEELGYKSYDANLESAYMEAMQKLDNDSYSKEPVETSYGYHIIYRIDQKEKPKYEDIKEDILKKLATDKLTEDTNLSYIALDKMREEAGLKFSDTVLEKKYEKYISQYK